jgi:PAS domain S-box-containing protein
VLVLLLGLGLSVVIFQYLRAEYMRTDQAHFDYLVGEGEAEINARMSDCVKALRGGQALFNTMPVMTRDRWRVFAETLDLPSLFPGVQGLAVAFAVSPDDATDFIADIRSDGRPDFWIKPFTKSILPSSRGSGGPLYIATYREPETSSDAAVFGTNFAEEPHRREAMDKARDTATTVLSGPINLMTDSAKRAALVLYAPFYHAKMPISTVEQRRQAIRGWVCAGLIAEDFLNAIMAVRLKELDLSFYDGGSTSRDDLLYASNRKSKELPDYEHLIRLELAGRTFTLGWQRSALFHSSRTSTPVWAGISSTVIAVLLAVLVAGLLSSRKRVKEALTRQDVELAYQKFALDQHAIVAITAAEGVITYANEKFCAISGYSREELVGQSHRIVNSGVHPPKFFKQMYSTITQGKVWQGEICNRRKNGELNWVSATIVPFLGPDGLPQKYVAIRSDITALKRAEELISERERLIRAVTDGLPGLVAYWTADLRCTFANRGYREWFGRAAESMIGMHMVELLGEELFHRNEPHVEAALKGEAQSFERTLTKANGEIGHTWAQYVPDFGTDGKTVKGFFVLISDVTEVKSKTEALREAAQRLQLAAAITQIGVWEWNLVNNRVLADERMFEIYGLPLAADGYFPFEIWRTVVLPEDLPTQMAHLSQTIKAGGRSRRQFRIHRQNDGALRYIEAEEEVQFDQAGKAVRVIGVNRDITDMVQAEIALMESEARTRMFAEHAPASVAMFDREMRYLVVSKQWITDYKLDGKSVIGRCHYDVFPEIPERWKAIHRRCLDGAVETALSDSFKRPDGSVQWLQWEVRPWHTPDGSVGGVVMFTLDITERNELEARLEKARDDALAASRLKSEFLATMSHEIRTPMNGVIGMASLLLETPLESKQREMAQALVNSADRLLVIINDVLDFSKIEAGKMRIEPVNFSLRDVIEETVALLATPAHRKNLQLTCDIDPVLATGLSGDSGRIQQILANLLGNAVKFTQSGAVAVTAAALKISELEISFRISISDTGIGITAAAKEQLFQPFVQADGSTTKRFGGTGLGLAICSQLIALMGGRIGLESKIEIGSTFWFELSLPRIALPEIETSEMIPAEARILIVDSHEVNRMVLLRQLATLQVSARAVSSANEALDTLQHEADGPHQFNIVLFDWNLPEMDGQALARAIRADSRIAATCLIVLSSTCDIIEPGIAAELKFHAILAKPIRDAQLRRCLLRVYGRRSTPIPFPNRQILGGRGLKLLLAEDNETNQLVARLMLEKLGHTIEVAENGHAVLEWLESEPFDAVLMDCQMPGMDGYATTRHIRAGKVKGVDPAIPIIALTAYAMPADRTRAMDAGMDDYVSKPLSKETLHAALARSGLIESPSRRPTKAASAHAAEPVPEKVLDFTQREKLQAISASDGVTVWDKAIGIFLKEMPVRLAALSRHASEQSGVDLANVAHTIAGSAASIGAVALRSTALVLETAARSSDWALVTASLRALQEAWRLLEPELLKPTNL